LNSFSIEKSRGPGSRFGGPRPNGCLQVHGGPRAAAAEGLIGARARCCSDEWKLAGGGEKEEEASGVPTVGEGGRCGAGGRPATVDHNGGGLELGVGQVEARRGEIESGMRCGGLLRWQGLLL
jgi:hypothetical protein